MLRTTISRLKKVCTIACVPRFLRGYQPYSPGKLEIFSYAVLKKAPKSTKSTDDDEHEPKSIRHKENPEYLIIPDKEAKLPEKNEKENGPTENAKEEGITPIVLTPHQLNDSHNEECQRIIDKAFGKEEPEPIIAEQYCTHNVEEVRRAITKAELAKLQYTAETLKEQMVPDQRIPFGVFKSPEINVDTTTTEPEELITRDNALMTSTETAQAQIDPPKPQEQPADDLSFLKQSLRVLPAEEGNSELSERVRNAHAAMSNKLPLGDYVNVFKNAQFEPYLPQVSKNDNTEQIKERNLNDYLGKQVSGTEADQAVTESLTNRASEFDDQQENLNQGNLRNLGPAHTMLTNSQKIDEDPAIPINFDGMHVKEYVVRATTAKETEEQLAQKLENIEETPLVEAHTPKVEGFSITPRVLGQTTDSIKNYCDKNLNNPESSPGLDTSASYDEVAKRCLDTPTSQIDEILLKEMEKLGIPITGHRESGIRLPVCENDLVQMDVIKKPRRPVEKKDIDLESHECERGAVDLCETEEDDRLNYPILLINKESTLPDHDEEELMQLVELIKSEQIRFDKLEEHTEEVSTMHPNQVLIDPYDKKTIALDTGEYDPNEWQDPKRGYSYILPYYKNKAENTRQTVVAKAKVAAEVLEDKMTQKTPAMSPNHFAWFSENTNRCMRRNLTFDESATSERRLILNQALKASNENNYENESNENMDLCNTSALGQHQAIEDSSLSGRQMMVDEAQKRLFEYRRNRDTFSTYMNLCNSSGVEENQNDESGSQMIVDEAQKRLFEYKKNRDTFSTYMNLCNSSGVENNQSNDDSSNAGRQVPLNAAQKGLYESNEINENSLDAYSKYMRMCKPINMEQNQTNDDSRNTGRQVLLEDSKKRLYNNNENSREAYSKYMKMCNPSNFDQTNDESMKTERPLLLSESQKQLYDNTENNENTMDTYSKYMDMCDPSGFWRHQYAVGSQEQTSQPNYMWQTDQTQQGYQSGSRTGSGYDYANNSYLERTKAPQSEFANMIVNTVQSEGIARSSNPVTPLLRKMSATRKPPGNAYSKNQGTYYLSKVNTTDNSHNLKETLRISEKMKEPSNINAVEKALNIKPSATIPEKLAHKVKTISLPPPTYRIYKHISRNHPKPIPRARPLKPKPLPAQVFTSPHRMHSSRDEALERKRTRSAKDWRRALDPPAPLRHEHCSNPSLDIVEDLNYENKTPMTVAQGPNYRYKTFANVSDEIWDAEAEEDSPLTGQYAQTNYTKELPEHADSESVEASTHAVKKSGHAYIAQELWGSEQLDPKHVLTCNETCPIALRSSDIKPSEANRLKAIYDQDFTKVDLRKDSRYNFKKILPDVDQLPEFEALPNVEGRPNMSNMPNVMHADTCLSPRVRETAGESVAELPEGFFEPELGSTSHTVASPVQITENPTLPKLNEDVSLSELLRRVRLKNKLLEQEKSKSADIASMSKCPKAPKCQPTAPRAPPNNPVVMPPFALPMLKPRPRTCPPRKKKPKAAKFSTCELDVDTGLPLGSHATIACPEMVCEMNGVGTYDLDPNGKMTVADLTEDIIERLHNLGKLLSGIWRGSKLVLSRDYSPWTPIPSWPTKKKTVGNKKPSRCDPGCKSYPPTRAEYDPPCAPKPCEGFPKKHFSLLDCFAVSLGDHEVYDISEY